MNGKMLKRSRFNVYFKKNGNAYLYNSLTGAFVLLEEDFSKFYENEDLWYNDKDKLEEFKKGGFIVEAEFDEVKYYYLRVIDALWRSNDRHSFTILTTTGCNFACPYCYEAQYGVRGKYMDRITQEMVVNFIEKRIKARPKKVLSLTFYGGEPLLNKEAIFFIGEKLKEIATQMDMEFRSDIVTNGYLLTPDLAMELHKRVNLISAQITVDGPEEVHNIMRPLKGGGKTFNVIMKNIKDILDNVDNFFINCRSNLNKKTYKYYEELLQYVDLQIRSKVKNPYNLSCYPYFVTGEKEASYTLSDGDLFTTEEFGKIYGQYLLPLLLKYKHIKPENIIPEPKFSLCMAPTPDSLLIEPDGSLQKCWDIVGMKKYSIGDIWNGVDVARETKWLGYEFWDEKCSECNMLPVCSGGCAKNVIVDKERVCDFRKFAIHDILILAADSKVDGD